MAQHKHSQDYPRQEPAVGGGAGWYDAVSLTAAVHDGERLSRDLMAILAAADRLAEAVENGTLEEVVASLAEYRRIREGREG